MMTKRQKVGIALIVLSLLVGLLGSSICIYLSFVELETAEFGGIGPVGDQIRNALLFSIAAVVGSIAGALLVIFGRAKATPPKQ